MSTDLGKRAALVTSFGVIALLCAGCAPSTGTVSGTVKYKDKPVPGGIVTFQTANGARTGNIDNTGGYTANDVPLGTAKVSVHSSTGPRMPAGKKMYVPPELQKGNPAGKDGTKGVDIPQKYGNPETSGLSVTVKSGDNPYNIDLKD